MIKLNIQRFGHTNSTPNYELPQFVGSDKPQWLTDINQGFLAIDTAIHNAYALASLTNTNVGDISDLTTTVKTDVVSAVNEINGGLGNLGSTVASHTTAIGNNTTAIGNLADLDTVDKTNLVGAINEVDLLATNNATNIGNLNSLDTTNKNNLVGAINEVKGIADDITKFNLTVFKTYDVGSSSDFVCDNANFTPSGKIYIATNSDGSIFKMYGTMGYTNNSANVQVVHFTFKNTGVNPTSAFNVDTAGFKCVITGGDKGNSYGCNLEVASNGEITISESMIGNESRRQFLFPCLYFAKNFGDTPTPPTP